MGPSGTLAHMTDWAGKLPGAVARIAGVLHVAKYIAVNPAQVEIEAETMDAALRIGNVLLVHARAAFAMMGAVSDPDDARTVLRWIERGQRHTFTRRDCQRDHQCRFPRSEDLDAVLKLLTEKGYIQRAPSPVGKAGRPAEVYKVNPKIFGE